LITGVEHFPHGSPSCISEGSVLVRHQSFGFPVPTQPAIMASTTSNQQTIHSSKLDGFHGHSFYQIAATWQ
jgi:hypothetical protein